jgi:hypothetical protein
VLGVAFGAHSALAAPSSCADRVSGLQSYLNAHPDASGTARQTKDAQLMHQPTRESVAKAKQESRENLVAMLAKAKAEQGAGDDKGCRATLAGVAWMLKP